MFEPSKKLSPHFTLAEMTVTKSKLANHPDAEQIARLMDLCVNVLEPIRARWGALRVTSGYRSEGVNYEANGAITSQHLRGEAADIVPLAAGVTCDDVFAWLTKVSGLDFDQAINEQKTVTRDGEPITLRWIHISFTTAKKNRRQYFSLGAARPVGVVDAKRSLPGA